MIVMLPGVSCTAIISRKAPFPKASLKRNSERQSRLEPIQQVAVPRVAPRGASAQVDRVRQRQAQARQSDQRWEDLPKASLRVSR